MNEFREKMIREIELRNLSKTTSTAYIRGMSRLVNHYSKSPDEIGIEEIKDFLFFFKNENAAGRTTKRSPNSVNGVASAISFYYRTVLKINFALEMPRMKYRKYTPTVLTSEEVNSMIDGIHNVFWKAVIMTLYSAGLRQSELRALKIKDIDTKRMVLHIREAKGARDRQAILSPIVLKCLRTYWRLFRYNSVSSDYVFMPTQNKYNGEFKKSLSHTGVAHIVKRASEIAKIKKKFILTA
jgi:integrase/recombinase XerD